MVCVRPQPGRVQGRRAKSLAAYKTRLLVRSPPFLVLATLLAAWCAFGSVSSRVWANPAATTDTAPRHSDAHCPPRRVALALGGAAVAETWGNAGSVQAAADLDGIRWNEPKRPKTAIAELAQEFTTAFQRTQWGVNGRVEPRFFSDDFVFRDPDVSTNGLQAYAQGTGTVLSGCRADAVDVTILDETSFTIRWRIEGTTTVPFGGVRIKPYIVSSKFTINKDGLVDSETDSFSIPTWDILLSAFAPWLPFLAPPEPPVQSPFA